MSTTSSNSERKAELLAELIEGAATQLKLAKELAKELKARKPRATTGEPRGSAWTSWTSQCKTLFPEAYDAHVKELPLNDKGKQPTNDIMGFATKARNSTHIKEWTEFEAKWLEEHPKPAKAPKVVKAKVVKASGGAGAPPPASDADSSDSDAPSAKASPAASKTSKASKASPAASASSKKSAKPSKATPLPAAMPAPEEKPKAKRLTKAEKEAKEVEASKASEAAAKASPPTPFTYRGKAYLKNEHNQVWTVGPDGSVGDWHGVLSADGKKLEKSDGPA